MQFFRLALIGVFCVCFSLAFAQTAGEDRPIALDAAAGEISGKVMVVNTDNRMLTIRTPDGQFQVIHVPPEVRRLDEIKIDDELTISYFEAVAVDLRKGGSGTPEAVVTKDVERDATAKPAGRMEETITVTGIIEAIDNASSKVTIRGPERTVTVSVQNPELLTDVSVGDSVVLTYVSAVAASIE
jgi:hypothetical protein